LYSFRIESNTEVTSNRFEISNIRTALTHTLSTSTLLACTQDWTVYVF